MIIESPEIANTQRAIFKIVWEFCALSKAPQLPEPQMMVRKVGHVRKGADNKAENSELPEKPDTAFSKTTVFL